MINKLMYKIGGGISTFIEGIFAPLNILPYAVSALVRDKREVRKTYSMLFYKEVFNVGVKALPLSLVMGLSIGALSVILFPFETISFGIDNIYGSMYVNLLFRETAPLITSLIVIIRSSIGITIELTQMSIDGEIDTLEIIGINPIQYLGSFRVFAG
ncbi:MAG TPA: ABC transporter permease, partial [Spirochaetota bacterium]|nr:ABC transporter permease [Spirochaetota bacterium]